MTSPWMLKFGGHHLALNITMAGYDGVNGPIADRRANPRCSS
jgi:hypothetical protein